MHLKIVSSHRTNLFEIRKIVENNILNATFYVFINISIIYLEVDLLCFLFQLETEFRKFLKHLLFFSGKTHHHKHGMENYL